MNSFIGYVIDFVWGMFSMKRNAWGMEKYERLVKYYEKEHGDTSMVQQKIDKDPEPGTWV